MKVLLTAFLLVVAGATAGALVDDPKPPKGTGTVQKGTPPPHVPTIFRAPRKPARGKGKPATPATQPPANGRRGGSQGH
jgi:hypothetical protein